MLYTHTHIYVSSANRQFTLFFSDLGTYFIPFSLLISLSQTSTIILIISGKIGHPCSFPNLRRKTFSFLALGMMLSVDLSYMGLIMFKYIAYMPYFMRASIIKNAEFCQIFLCLSRLSHGFYLSIF